MYGERLDVYTTLDGQRFVWDSSKARANVRKHGVSFESAREAVLDPLARFEDASPHGDERQACIGLTAGFRLLYVVQVVWDAEAIRIISARPAESDERRRYEDE